MSPRLLVLLSPVLASATAYAQAPGEVVADPYYAQPPSETPVAPAATPYVSAAISPMAHRWAVGLSFGGMGIHPEGDGYDEGTSDANESTFRIAELAIRYRASRRIEIELSLGGGREVVEGSDGDTDGELAMGNVTVAARYRFRPEHKWNWWLMAGLGGTIVAPHVSTEEERDAATRPHGTFGIGVERRFRRFALRGVAMGEPKGYEEGSSPPDVPDDRPVPVPTEPVPDKPPQSATALTAGDSVSSPELGGGVFTIGASYYF